MTPTVAEVVAAARRIHADHTAVVRLGSTTVTVAGGRYLLRRRGGAHSIAVEAEITPLARLVAHLAGFTGVEVLDVPRALREHPAPAPAPGP